jgi:hypothetical protein
VSRRAKQEEKEDNEDSFGMLESRCMHVCGLENMMQIVWMGLRTLSGCNNKQCVLRP